MFLLVAWVLLASSPAVFGLEESSEMNIVVIMFENRAFDHVLGHLASLNPNIRGLKGDESNPIDPLNPSSPRVRVTLDADDILGLNPQHQLSSTEEQLWGSRDEIIPPAMSGFIVASNSTLPMKAYNFSTVPAISTLAMEFALFDTFLSSIPGPTGPNRLYVHTGTSHGVATNLWEGEILGYDQRSFYMDLKDSGRTWGVYFEDFPVTLEVADTRVYFPTHYHHMDKFVKDAREGKLPNYSFLEPRWGNEKIWEASTQHPDNSMLQGEMLLKEVYEALRKGPKWNDTVLIVMYDEHGGLFDHHTSPSMHTGGAPNPDGLNSTLSCCRFNFTRSGIRVPFVAVSPRISKGSLHHEPSSGEYEHTSVMKTARKWLNLPAAYQRPLTKREEWAASFEHVLDLDTPRTDCPTTLPLSAQAQRLWPKYQLARKRSRMSDAEVERLPDHPWAHRKLGDLELDVVYTASAVVDDPVIPMSQMEKWTQGEMGPFLRRQLRKIQQKYNKK